MIGVKSLVGLPRGCQARKLLFQFQSEDDWLYNGINLTLRCSEGRLLSSWSS